MTLSIVGNELIIALQRTSERVSFKLKDADGELVDATALTFELRRGCGNSTCSGCGTCTAITKENFFAPPTRIVRTGVGQYYINLGDSVISSNPELVGVGTRSAIWHVEVDDEAENFVQFIRVISICTLDLIGRLRRQIDKAAKLVSEDPEEPCFLGYTTGNLLEYLDGGINVISGYQPYPTFCTVDDFPGVFRQILIDSAMLVGINSQELFAIDSDVPNYSAQGSAFVIQHQPQLAAYATRLSQTLDKRIPDMKKHLVRSGSAHIQLSPSLRFARLIQMSPDGFTFRNFWTR